MVGVIETAAEQARDAAAARNVPDAGLRRRSRRQHLGRLAKVRRLSGIAAWGPFYATSSKQVAAAAEGRLRRTGPISCFRAYVLGIGLLRS
jgi:hypothetical protein